MNAFFEALSSVSTIFILIVVGYILQSKKKITKEIGTFLSYIVVHITLPCSIFNTMTTTIDLKGIGSMVFYVVAVMISQVLSILAAMFIAKVSKIEELKKGSFIALTAFNNTLFMGMPVSVALFGERSATVILCYYIASAILFWTLGIRIIAGKKVKGKFKIPFPVYGILCGVLILIITYFVPQFKLPSFALDTIGYLGKMTTPLSMIFTGYALGEFGLKNIRIDRSITLGLLARFVVSPLIFIIVIVIMGADEFYKNVFIVQAFMPVMASQTIIARQYEVDDSYPSVMVTISTLISLIIIPIVKVIIT